MRLADYIDSHLPPILKAWEAFAGTQVPAATHMDSLALRDHAEQILRAVSLDLRSAQDRLQQHRKSEGHAPVALGTPHTAAQVHAVLRAHSGFTVGQLVAEYRALRASVLRLWLDTQPAQHELVSDIGRFNEAIDQAVAESVDFYSQEIDRWRHVFLGMLGHDLRNPLNVIMLSSQTLSRMTDGTPADEATDRLIKSGRRMRELLDDLLDYSRSAMGLGIRVQRVPGDLARLCAAELAIQRAAHPHVRIQLVAETSMPGEFDESRMRQLVANLVTNAVKHGDPAGEVKVELAKMPHGLQLEVVNTGSTIEPAVLENLFDPFRRSAVATSDAERSHMGLGLFIVRQIAEAHGGTVSGQSVQGRTVFQVLLPADSAGGAP